MLFARATVFSPKQTGNKASPAETGKPTTERKLTAFSPSVRPTLKQAPPGLSPQALPGSPPRRRGCASSGTPAGLQALAAAGREARRRGAATRHGQPGCPHPLPSPYLRGPGARGRPAPRRRPARPTWAGLSERPARAEPKAAARRGGKSRAGPKRCGRRRRKHPSGRGGKSRAGAGEPGRREGAVPRCSPLSLPPGNRSQSKTSSAQPPGAGGRWRRRLTARRAWRKGRGGAPPGSGGCHGNGGAERRVTVVAWGRRRWS